MKHYRFEAFTADAARVRINAATAVEVEFLMTIGGQAAIAIHNSKLFEEIKSSRSQLESTNQRLEKTLKELARFYAALNPLEPAVSFDQVMETIIERLMEATGADAALIRLWDMKAGRFPIASHRGFADEYLNRVESAPSGGAVEWVVKHGEPIIAPNIALEPRLKGKVQLALGLRSCAILPLMVHGQVRGFSISPVDSWGTSTRNKKITS